MARRVSTSSVSDPRLVPCAALLLACCSSPEPAEVGERGGGPPGSSTAQLELADPRDRDRRGDTHLRAGRFSLAIEDFDSYLEAYPEAEPYHWRRGIAYYYAGRYAEGVEQFELHRSVNPADVENAAWHFLCLARKEDPASARAALLPVGHDRRVPMGEIYQLFAGQSEAADVLAAAGRDTSALFYAHLYLGLYHEAHGDGMRALTHIEAAATTHAQGHYMGDVAQVHWALLR